MRHLRSRLLGLNLTYRFANFSSNFVRFFHIHRASVGVTRVLANTHGACNLGLVNKVHHSLLGSSVVRAHRLTRRVHHRIRRLISILLDAPGVRRHAINVNHLSPRVTHSFDGINPVIHTDNRTHSAHTSRPFINCNLLPVRIRDRRNYSIVSHLGIHVGRICATLGVVSCNLSGLPNNPLVIRNFACVPRHFTLNFTRTPHNSSVR